MMPTCSSRASLRGEAEASTSFGRWPLPFEARGLGVSLLFAGLALSAGSGLPPMSLFEAVRNPSLSEIIGCHLDQNLVAGKHPDPVLAHPSRRMGDDLVFVLELHPERGVGEKIGQHPREFEHFFFRHKAPAGFQKFGGEWSADAAKSRNDCWDVLPRYRAFPASLPFIGGSACLLLGLVSLSGKPRPLTRELNAMRYSGSSWAIAAVAALSLSALTHLPAQAEDVKSAD